jgi:hypothetical protein
MLLIIITLLCILLCGFRFSVTVVPVGMRYLASHNGGHKCLRFLTCLQYNPLVHTIQNRINTRMRLLRGVTCCVEAQEAIKRVKIVEHTDRPESVILTRQSLRIRVSEIDNYKQTSEFLSEVER